MKTHGICNAQSARKHRRAGHVVQENGDGRYRWSLPTGKQMLGRAIRLGGTIATHTPGISGMKPTGIIVDECNHPLTGDPMMDEIETLKLSGRMVEIDHPVRREPKALASLAARHPDGTAVLLETGDRYWPKRRNQHSKAVTVVGFMAGTLDVMYLRDGAERPDSMTVRDFLSFIGKRA